MREMKDSGIEWIGEIPKDWKITRVGNHFYFYSGDSLTSEDLNDDGIYPVYGANGIRGFYNKKNLTGSHIILGRVGALCGNVHLVDSELWVTEHALVSVPFTEYTINEFYKYMFETMNFRQYSKASAQPVLSAEVLRQLKMPIPKVSEQKRIADYLDEKCTKIEAIIEKQQEIIEKLKEYKLSVITEAVTKGLNPDVEMKDSGDDRIGYIPIKWSKIKITRLLDYAKVYPIGDGDHGLIKANNYKEEGIPYIRVQNLGWGTDLLLDNVVYISEEDNERIINSELHPNDILFCKTGATIGKIGIVPHEIKRANTTSHVGKITLDCKYNSRFVFYYLSSEIGYEKFWDIACMKSTRPELSIEEIKSIYVAVPSFREEQDAIVNYLDNICSGIEARKEKVEKMVTKLQDYKKSLIYEVVTGKKEI